MALYAALHPDEGLDVGVEAVGHQLELSVRRDEGDRAVVLKPGQSEDRKVFESKHLQNPKSKKVTSPHALMELDILELHALALAAAGGLEQHLVVEPQPQLGHAGQVHSHLDVAADLGPGMLGNVYVLLLS